MVTTANGSPAEGHMKVIVQFVTIKFQKSSHKQSSYIHIRIHTFTVLMPTYMVHKVMYRYVYTYSTNNVPGHNTIPLYWKQ